MKVFIEIQVAFATSCLLVFTEWEIGIESSQRNVQKAETAGKYLVASCETYAYANLPFTIF